MADYGTSAADYTADVNTYSGLIGKIAKQIITDEGIKSEYAGLFKDPMRTGKDLEVAVYKKATGVDYSATDAPAAPFPAKEVLLFKQNKKRTYGVKLDQKEIDEGANDVAAATEAASAIVRTLYSGAYDEENGYIYSIFHEADAEEGQIIDAGNYEEPTDATTAKTLLAKIKNFAKYVRRGRAKVNPKGLNVRAEKVCLLIPTEALTAIDVWAKLDGQNLDFARLGVDEVYEYDVEEGENAEIYVFDSEYAQIRHVHADSYKEQPVAGCDNVNAYLHRYVMYAGCPLFSCVRMTETSGGAPSGVQHVIVDGVKALVQSVHGEYYESKEVVPTVTTWKTGATGGDDDPPQATAYALVISGKDEGNGGLPVTFNAGDTLRESGLPVVINYVGAHASDNPLLVNINE